MTGKVSKHEPIANWWDSVVEPILTRHFYGTDAEKQAAHDARIINAEMSQFTNVLHVSELGIPIRTVFDKSMQDARNVVAQRWGRFYCLLIVRWMSDVFYSQVRHPDSPYATKWHHEHFQTFTVSDSFLLNRKKWPLS
jgi:hypothetical protein